MRQRETGTGYRQKAWDALRRQAWPNGSALAEAIGCTPSGLRSYLGALKKQGYVATAVDGTIALVKNSGPRAPASNIHNGDFRDWNLDKPMSPAELRRVIKATGLSLSGWLALHGFDVHGATRLRQMLNGQRPINSGIEAAARLRNGVSIR